MNKKDSPIFIVGIVRSGTTLLRSILNSHPNITIPKETSFFYLIEEYQKNNKITTFSKKEVDQFWNWYSQNRRFTYLELNKNEVKKKIDLLKDSKDFKNVLDAVMYTNLVVNKKNRWGEKTPGHEMYLDKIFEFYPKAKVIFMIRDPRSIYASQNNVPWGKQFVSVVIKRWNISIKWFKKFENDNRLLLINYEDLVNNPSNTVKSICEFIGEDFYNEMIEDRIKLTDKKVKGNWTSKYENEVNRGIDNKSLSKWKSELSNFDISVIENVCDKEIFDKFYDRSLDEWDLSLKIKFYYLKFNHYLKAIIKN